MGNDDPELEDSALPDEEQFETTPEEATGFGASVLKPAILERKKLMILICCSLAVVIGGGLIFNIAKPPKKKASDIDNEFASQNSSQEFLSGLQARAVSQRTQEEPPAAAAMEAAKEGKEPDKEPEPALPPVSFNRPQETRPPYPPQASQGSSAPASGGGGQPQQTPTHYSSALVPSIQGSLFSQGASSQNPAAAARPASNDPYSAAGTARNPYGQANDYNSQYDQQNKQDNKQAFYDAASGGETSGQYLGVNSVWTGTIIPGVLETAINTDLPGNVLARVTQNIYDSKTGRNLLIPQGTTLLARYNSSVSFAQKRVQIVWDTMIRPDGFQINLEGANGVDRAGISGQPAKIQEHWFEYLKAAGIITLFSYANAKMTEASAKYASESAAAGIASSNADFVSDLGSKLTGRATNIQPTLTVDNGTVINIMLNKTLYLPPVAGYPASEKYLLE